MLKWKWSYMYVCMYVVYEGYDSLSACRRNSWHLCFWGRSLHWHHYGYYFYTQMYLWQHECFQINNVQIFTVYRTEIGLLWFRRFVYIFRLAICYLAFWKSTPSWSSEQRVQDQNRTTHFRCSRKGQVQAAAESLLCNYLGSDQVCWVGLGG